MKLELYCARLNFFDQTELKKVLYLAYYHQKVEKIVDFTVSDVVAWFQKIHLPKPNSSRLNDNLQKSKKFIRGSNVKSFRLHASEIRELEAALPELNEKSEEILSDDSMLPSNIFMGTRGFIEKLSKQINASYENNIFDGCAVLMRRLLEVLLILSYEELKIDNLIRDQNTNYLLLDGIIKDSKLNPTLNLSRNAKANLDDFRKLGNFSAHKIHYNCTKKDIDQVKLEYRATIEELLYKSSILK
jgi:hypothetical protein